MVVSDVFVYPLVWVRRRYPTVISEQVRPDGLHPVERSAFLLFELIADNGLRGIGEVSDIPPEALPDPAEVAEELRRLLLGRSPYEVGTILDRMQFQRHETRTLTTRLYDCAVDMALYDLQAQAAGVPLCQFLGGRQRSAIGISAVIYIRDPSLVAEEVHEYRQHGFTDFKLKVGLGLEHDEACVAAVREAAGPSANLKVDPNGAWTVDEAITALKRLHRFNLCGVETPVPADDLQGKLAVKQAVPVPILEHVGDPRFALECVRSGAVDVFNIALCSTGGIYRARQVAAIAAAANVPCLLGSTLELWPGTAAQAHFGAVLPRLEYPSDLVGPLMYQSDVVQRPWHYRSGTLPIAETPGLGVTLDHTNFTPHAGARPGYDVDH